MSEAVSQAELAGRLEVTQGAISKLEHSDDVRVSPGADPSRQGIRCLTTLVTAFVTLNRTYGLPCGRTGADGHPACGF
jgi:transcriptional regulator with XRE-family HTH domain